MVGSSEWANGWIARRRVAPRKYKDIRQERIWSSSLLYYLNLFYTSAGGFGLRLLIGRATWWSFQHASAYIRANRFQNWNCTRPIVKRSRPSSPNGWSWKAPLLKHVKEHAFPTPATCWRALIGTPPEMSLKVKKQCPSAVCVFFTLRLFGERCRDSWTCRLAVPSATCYLFTWADNFKLLAIGIQRSWCHICPMFCSVMSVRSGCLNGFSTVDHWPDRKNYMIFCPDSCTQTHHHTSILVILATCINMRTPSHQCPCKR